MERAGDEDVACMEVKLASGLRYAVAVAVLGMGGSWPLPEGTHELVREGDSNARHQVTIMLNVITSEAADDPRVEALGGLNQTLHG